MNRFALSVFVLPVITGCASAVYMPKVDAVGEYKSMKPVEEKAETIPDGSTDDVKAVVGELLPGMSYKDGLFNVDPNRYDVLGKVSAKPATDFFYPYKEGWRRPACWPQRVLLVATLFTWAAVPTSWPCFVSDGTVDDRRENIIATMKKATKALGGNLVLIGGFGGLVTINARSGAVVNVTEVTEGVGWAIRVKQVEETPVDEPKATGAKI